MSLLTDTLDSLNWEAITFKFKECENLIVDPKLDNNRRVEVQKLYSFLSELLLSKKKLS